MAYCNKDDLLKLTTEEVLIQLSDLSAPDETGEPDEAAVAAAIDAVIAEAIETADAQIDGYIANRVDDVPLTTIPVLITKISAKMALHELYSNRMTNMMPPTVSDWYKECLRMLEAIRSGKMQLVLPAGAEGPGEYRINKTDADQIFPKKELDKY